MEDGGWMMIITLPSGRSLHYLNATVDEEVRTGKKDGRPYTVQTIHYAGIEHSTSRDDSGKAAKKNTKWGKCKTYGGKLCENIVQAIARDTLLHGLKLAHAMGFPIFGLFHDELAAEVEDTWDGLRLDDLITCMSAVPSWAPGLILGADGYTSKVYKKE
jgi:DNA polymerase